MRRATIARSTKETEITVAVGLDGTGAASIATGVGFFDHMLEQVARHGLIDLDIKAKGDLHIDAHHTVEDTGIALGTRDPAGAGRAARHYALRLARDADGRDLDPCCA